MPVATESGPNQSRHPVQNTHTVALDGNVTTGSTTVMSGYTIVEQNSMEAALEVAKASPFPETGGSLEMVELDRIPG